MDELLSTRLRDLHASIERGTSYALAEFWTEIEQRGTPLIEPATAGSYNVTFLWRGDDTTRSVNVVQDWGTDGIPEHLMTRLPDTDVWFKTRVMPSDTRTTYQLAPDPLPAVLAGGFPLMPDPLNPHRFSPYYDETGFTISFSHLVLPDAPAQPWLNPAIPAGTVTLHTPFADGRRIWVYVPATVAEPPHALLVAFDGRLANDILGLPKMLDLHLAGNKIRPTIALMIDNPDRRELMCDPTFADYVVQQILPWARSTFPVTSTSANTIITGSSFGGLCASFVALRHPNVFGGVLSQTGWFRWHPDDDPEHEWLARQFIANPVQPLRFYMDVGCLEHARMLDGGPSQLVANRYMRDVLRAKGYEVMYREYSGGHDYSSVQSPLFDALPLLLG